MGRQSAPPGTPPSTTAAGRDQRPAFALRFSDGRALLVARGMPLGSAASPLTGANLDEVELEIPGVRFPIDVSGGAERFHHRRMVLRKAVVTADGRAVLGTLPLRARPHVLDAARISIRDGSLEIEARTASSDVVLLRATLLACPPSALEIVVTHALVVGASPPAGLTLAASLLQTLGGDEADAGPLLRRVEVLRLAVREVLNGDGWKTPDFSALRDLRVAAGDGLVRLTASADPLDDLPPVVVQERLARVVAASSLLRGWLTLPADEKREQLDRLAAHPLALALAADVLACDGVGLPELNAVVADALHKHPGELDLHLAYARLAPSESSRWKSVAQLARARGDDGLAHAAALAWASRVPPEALDDAKEALSTAAQARPDSSTVALGLALLAERTGDHAEALRASRRALELGLAAGEEVAAARCLGRARLALGDVPGARKALLRALRHGDEPRSLEVLGQLHEAEGRAGEAVRALVHAAQLFQSSDDKARALREAAWATCDVLHDPGGSLALWQQALALVDKAEWRVAAAEAAWLAGEVELTLQWTLGPHGELPHDAKSCRLAGLALWRLGGRDGDALALLETAGNDVAARSPPWAAALDELRGRVQPVRSEPPPPVPEPLPGLDMSLATDVTQAMPLDDVVMHLRSEEATAQTLGDHDPVLARTRAYEAFKALDAAVTDEALATALAVYEALGDVGADIVIELLGCAELRAEAALALVRALALRSAKAPLKLLDRLQRRGVEGADEWHAVSAAAVRHCDLEVERLALEALAHLGQADIVEKLRLADLWVAAQQQEKALSLLVPDALSVGGAAAESAVAIAEELGLIETALQVMEAAEARCTGIEALQWARRARTAASLAGRPAEAVAAARRAARIGTGDDADQLEEALEAANELVELCDILWERARSELDAERAVRAARLDLTTAGRGAETALRALLDFVDAAGTTTPVFWSAVRDAIARCNERRLNARAWMALLRNGDLSLDDKRAAAAELAGMALEHDLAAESDELILEVFPEDLNALARMAQRHAASMPGLAALEAVSLEQVLQNLSASASDRMAWLQFAATHAAMDGLPTEVEILERLLELARREPDAARAAGVARRVLLIRLADLYDLQGQHLETVRVLSHAEVLDAPPDERAFIFRRIGELEEHRLGRPERAAEALSHAMRAVPDDEDAARALARLLDFLGRYEELAALHAERAARAPGASRVAYLLLEGDLRATHLGQMDRAIELYRQALAAAPLSEAPLKRLLEAHRNRPPSGLVRTYLMAARLRASAEASTLLEDAGAILAGLMDRARLAAVVFAAAARLNTRSESALRALVELHRTLGNAEAANAALRALIEITQDARARANARLARAELLQTKLGDPAAAWRELSIALDEIPEAPWLLAAAQKAAQELGLSADVEQLVQRRADAASETDRRGVLLDGAAALMRMGAGQQALVIARLFAGEHPSAAAWQLVRDAAVMSDDSGAQLAATRALVAELRRSDSSLLAAELEVEGDLLRGAGRHGEAARVLTEALEWRPDDARLKWKLAAALLNTGDAPEAWRHFSTLHPAQLSDVSAEDFVRMRAIAASNAGVPEALDAFRQVTDLLPEELWGWQQLGRVAESANAWGLAGTAWRRSAELAKDPQDRARFLRRLARALADASEYAAAADAVEEARQHVEGPAAELARAARWRLNAGDAAAAAKALLGARSCGADLPEELVAAVAMRLVAEAAAGEARRLVAAVKAISTSTLARVGLDLIGDSLELSERARLWRLVADDVTDDKERAVLLERSAWLWWDAGDASEALRTQVAAWLVAPSTERAFQSMHWALCAARWDLVESVCEKSPDAATALLGEQASTDGRVAALPDVLLHRWCRSGDVRALQERAQRVERTGVGDEQAALEALVLAARDDDDLDVLSSADEAARRLASMAAGREDLAAACRWSHRIRRTGREDLDARLRWQTLADDWNGAMATVEALVGHPDVDAAAMAAKAVEIARDRLEDLPRALRHARRWVDIRPDLRASRASLVELLEETQTFAEAADEVAAWAEKQRGVEAKALWRKAAELARDAEDPKRWASIAGRAFAALDDRASHEGLLAALDASGAMEAAAQQAKQWAQRSGLEADWKEAAERLQQAGLSDEAGLAWLKAHPQPVDGPQETLVMLALVASGDDHAVAERLRARVRLEPSNVRARLEFLRSVPRSATSSAEVARISDELARLSGRPSHIAQAAASLFAAGDREGARSWIDKALAAGSSTPVILQLRRALDVRSVDRPAEARQGAAPGWEEMAWLRGDRPPSGEQSTEHKPSWILRRLEARALEHGDVAIAGQAVAQLHRRGGAFDERALRERDWLASNEGLPTLLEIVRQSPRLGRAACELATGGGAQALVEVARCWAEATSSDSEAAQAWDGVAAAAVELLDTDLERQALKKAQSRVPSAKRARKLLELAASGGDVDGQLKALDDMARLDPENASHWTVERAQLLVEGQRLDEAAQSLEQIAASGGDSRGLWLAMLRQATQTGDSAQELRALRALVENPEDWLAVGAVHVQRGELDHALDAASRAEADGTPFEAVAWLRLEVLTRRGDEAARFTVLGELARGGSVPAAEQLAELASGDVERHKLVEIVTRSDRGDAAWALVRADAARRLGSPRVVATALRDARERGAPPSAGLVKEEADAWYHAGEPVIALELGAELVETGADDVTADWLDALFDEVGQLAHARRGGSERAQQVLARAVKAVTTWAQQSGEPEAVACALRGLFASEEAESLVALLRTAAAGPASGADVVTRALRRALTPLPHWPEVLERSAWYLRPDASVDVTIALWLSAIARDLGQPEQALVALELLAIGGGEGALTASLELAGFARAKELASDEIRWLRRALQLDGRCAAAHQRLADVLPAADALMHLLALVPLAESREDALRAVRTAAAAAGHDALAAAMLVALAGATGGLSDGDFPSLANLEARAASEGFPSTSLDELISAARLQDDRRRLAGLIEAALVHGAVPPHGAHAELAEILAGLGGHDEAALDHAELASLLLPLDEGLARQRLELAQRRDDPRAIASALLHLAHTGAPHAEKLVLDAAEELAVRAGAPDEAVRALDAIEEPGAHVIGAAIRFATMSGKPALLAHALERSVASVDDDDARVAVALKASEAWAHAGQAGAAVRVLANAAATSGGVCARLLDAAFEKGEVNGARQIVEARWIRSGEEEKRQLIAEWLARAEPAGMAEAVRAATGALLSRHVGVIDDDAGAWLWLARDAETAHRWEDASRAWRSLAKLSHDGVLSAEANDALQTLGVAFLARTGALDEAEEIARVRILSDPSDRSALEVVLAATRARGDAAEVVRLLSMLARQTSSADETAFIWREAAEWLGGALLDPGGAVTAMRAAAAIRPLSRDECRRLADLAARAMDAAAELEALRLIAVASPEDRAPTALRRAELMERLDRPPEEIAETLREALADSGSEVAAVERLAQIASTEGLASSAMEWIFGAAPPVSQKDAQRFWSVAAQVAEAAQDSAQAAAAYQQLAELGDARAWSQAATALAKSGRHDEAARAFTTAAQKQAGSAQRVELLRKSVAEWETAGNAREAEEARLQLLETDASDVATYDAVEVRLRRAGKSARLPMLALRVAGAQSDPHVRAAMFERAAILLRDVAGDEAGAAHAFSLALDADPDRVRSAAALSDLAFRRNNLEEAARWLASVPADAPADVVDLAPAELAYRRGVCSEALDADGREMLRRALELDPAHISARRALAKACQRHGDQLGAARAMMTDTDEPSPAREPAAYVSYVLRQSRALEEAGYPSGALALLEGAYGQLPGNLALGRALVEVRRKEDPAQAASLLRHLSQMAPAGMERAVLLKQEARAWEDAGKLWERADALALAAEESPQDLTLIMQALEAGASTEQDALLLRVSALLHALEARPSLPPRLHLAVASALRQDQRSDGALLLFHAERALTGEDTWQLRLIAVDGARRVHDAESLVRHVEQAVQRPGEPRMAAALAAEAARAALLQLNQPERGAALVTRACMLAPADAALRTRLTALFSDDGLSPDVAVATARKVIEATDFAPAYQWMGRAFTHKGDARRARLAMEAFLILGGKAPALEETTPQRAESPRAVSFTRDAEWLAPPGFPVRFAKTCALFAKELHALLPQSSTSGRPMRADEVRKVAGDIKFARSVVDVTLPVVVSDSPGVQLCGAAGPQLAIAEDLLRAHPLVRRAMLAVGFATVRWGLEASVSLGPADMLDMTRAFRELLGRAPADATERSRDLAAQLQRTLRQRPVEPSDEEMESARAGLVEQQLPDPLETRKLLARVAFLAAGELGPAFDALDRISWMQPRPAASSAWGKALLRWVVFDDGVRARGLLGLEEAL